MKSKIILLIFVSALLTGCSGSPSESDLAEVIQYSFKEELKDKLNTMSMFGGEKMAKSVAKSMGIPDPDSVLIKNVNIEDQTEKDNGDYVSKITYTLSVGDNEKKFAARITTTKVDGKLKIIETEDL